MKKDIFIYGGGIMGLSCARELALKGKKVVVFEKASLGAGASGAGSGVLMSRGARKFHSLFREFYVRSVSEYYPSWIEQLQRESDIPISIQKTGAWALFFQEKKWQSCLDQLKREESAPVDFEKALPSNLSGLLAEEMAGKAFFPEESYIDNRDLLKSLEASLLSLGVEIYTGPDWALDEGLKKVKTSKGVLESRGVLLAAGSWVDSLLKPLGWESRMVPVKGQLGLLSGPLVLPSTLHLNDHFYFVPRDGNWLVGATSEARESDQEFNQIGHDFLQENLQKYFPSWKYAPLQTWAGSRPRTRDRLPLMGWVDESAEIAICAGHYKNGLSMAPLAAKTMASLFTGSVSPIDISPWQPHRKKGLLAL